ncbi:hypothetical protein EYF80_009551 [Liparis tanakae]|uniref:Uncharacterized protein n=1 Tax=Liparis tanakae TaxID=230148 RepID=A0A4Z2IQT9_9TELE|nr:hypothetical protein EYF80_009551 [Liparis tanakae]
MDQVDRLSNNGLPLESKTPAQAREELLGEIRIPSAIQMRQGWLCLDAAAAAAAAAAATACGNKGRRGLACSRHDLHVENYTSTRSRASQLALSELRVKTLWARVRERRAKGPEGKPPAEESRALGPGLDERDGF